MMLLPASINEREYSLFVILEEENIERIKQYDPAEATVSKLGPPWTTLQLRDVVITYVAAGEEKDRFINMVQRGEINEALRMLSRGFAYRPDLGDHDRPYESAKDPHGNNSQA